MGETAAPTKRPIGERRLAAIVFTDVVGFSARVQENESLTLRLVKRDFAMMTAACVAAGGQVIKNTGDGLLMSFPTASAAVGCALKVQKHLVESAKNLPPDQVLQHRIGIHLGDVLITDGDAMGNDVNIAARVLAEAGGGEICVSQTVYDVVKHRLSIKGVYLGERELKNISEPVPIFKLPVTAVETPERKPTRKRLTMLLAAVAVIAVGIALVVALTSKSKPKEQEQPPALSAATTKPSAEFVDVIRTGGEYGRDGSASRPRSSSLTIRRSCRNIRLPCRSPTPPSRRS
jgi:class 3 adenylate cyclase